jgi:hypothetical protein
VIPPFRPPAGDTGFTLSGFEPVTPELIDPKVAAARTGEVRHGTRGGRPDVRMLGGYFDPGVVAVILARGSMWSDEFSSDDAHRVPQGGELAGELVCPGAGLQPDQARR